VSSPKLLAEWFWTDRWMGSSAFLLPMEARGLYREMLTQAWRRGAHLPTDHEMIRRAVGCTEAEWNRAWPLVKQYWREAGDFLVNDTQLSVYAETKAAQDRASDRGRKGAQARAQALLEQNSSNAQDEPEESPEIKPPSPSPGSVSGTDSNSDEKQTIVASAPILEVFEHWKAVMDHPGARLSPKRRRKIENRLRDYAPEQLKCAVDGCKASPFHQGANQEKAIHDDIELICRDSEHVDMFIARAPQANKPHVPQQLEGPDWLIEAHRSRQ
jgi:uncharacterized protein YdaU (DUF1376 family)